MELLYELYTLTIWKAQNNVWLATMLINISYFIYPEMGIKDDSKGQGNKEMHDQLRPVSVILGQVQGKAGVKATV